MAAKPAPTGFTLPPLQLSTSSSATSDAGSTFNGSGFSVSYGNRWAPWIIGGAVALAGVLFYARKRKG